MRALAFAAAFFLAGGAFAQSSGRVCHLTAFAGAVRGQSQHVHSSGMEITDRFEVSGKTAGAGFGCDWPVGNSVSWFQGFDADLAGADASGESRDLTVVGPAVTSGTRIDRLGSLRVRIGRQVSPAFSLYATAGAGYALAKATIASDDGESYSDSRNIYGGVLGGGVEAKLVRALSLRLEYLYFAFAKKSFFSPPPAGFVDRGGGLDPELHVLRVGLSLDF